jgi:4-amino-4-deoxy-L-arabinose transferase-like glycosyltransferase
MQVARGSGIFLIIVGLWYGLAEVSNPGYLRYFLWEENFLRYFTPHFRRSGPWYYFIGVLMVGFIPWTLIIPLALVDSKKRLRDDKTLFLLLWATLPILFFSLSNSKLPHYILPVYPPLSVLTARSLVRILQDASGRRRWALALPWLTLIAMLIPLNLILYWPGLVPAHSRGSSEPILKMISGEFVSLLLIIFLLGAWASLKTWWVRCAFPVSCGGLLLYVLLTEQTMEAVSVVRSSKMLAEKSASSMRSGTQIIVYDRYPASLPFYLRIERPIWVISSGVKRSLMGSSYIAEKNPQPAAGQGQVVFSFEGFAEQWQKSIQPLVIFIKEKDLPTLNLRVGTSQKQLLSFDTFVLVTNQ